VLDSSQYESQLKERSAEQQTWWRASGFAGKGRALLPGADIFEQYNLDIGMAYIINLDNPRQDPGKDQFGNLSRLFILTEEELQDGSPV
jgi:hypothetical protein